MAATGRVQYVLTGETSGLASALDDLTKRNEKLEQQVAKVTEKLKEKGSAGSSTYSQLTKGIGDFVAGVAGGIGAAQLFENALDKLAQKARALNEEIARVGQAGASQSVALGNVTAAGGNLSTGFVADLNRQINASAGLGTGGLAKVGGATSELFRRGFGWEQARDIVGGAADVVQAMPNENLTDISTGVGAIMRREGVSALGAQNMLLTGGGLITSPGARGAMLTQVQPMAESMGLLPGQTLGVLGSISSALQDTTGEQTTAVFQKLFARLPSMMQKAGLRSSGNLLTDLSTAASGGLGLGEDDASDILGSARSPQTKLALQSLLTAQGQSAMAANIASIYGQVGSGRNIAGERLAALRQADPGFAAREKAEQALGRIESERAGDVFGQQIGSEAEVLRARLQQEMRTAGYINAAVNRYTAKRLAGVKPAEAEAMGRATGSLWNLPVPFGGSIIDSATTFEMGVAADGLQSGKNRELEFVTELKKTNAILQTKTSRFTPLPSNANN